MAGVVTSQSGPLGYPAESGYTAGFALLGIAMLAAVVVASFIPDTHQQPTHSRLEDAGNAELGYLPANRPD